MSDNQKKKDKEDEIIRSGVTVASYGTIQRYGSAVKEHLVSYSGIDNENGIELQKSLKSIKEQGNNAEYAYSIRQQKAGWAAEVKDTANKNAEYIISGKSKRKVRHDDLANTPANHPLYDHVEVDAQGNIIDGSGTQMKFIGASEKDATGVGNAERALKKLQSKDFQKYLDNDVKIEVPKDEYQQMVDKATEEIAALQKQLEKVKANGNTAAVVRIEKKITNLIKLKKNLRPSTLTRKESLALVDTPILSTAKSVVNVSHRAGVEVAKKLAIAEGAVSIVRNIVSMYKGEEEIDEAAKNVAIDVTQSAISGYGDGFVGSAIKGMMQNASSEYTRALAKTNVAGTIVNVTISASKTMKRYFNGEIDGTQCLEDLGEQGTGMIASSLFTVIGQVAIPIPAVGGLIGSMAGYALSSATYGVLMSSLKEAKLAREERIAVEKACEEHKKMIREYRAQLDSIIEEYLFDRMEIFNDSFSGIKESLAIGDVDLLIESANSITDALGGKKPFETMDDFNSKMLLGETFTL